MAEKLDEKLGLNGLLWLVCIEHPHGFVLDTQRKRDEVNALHDAQLLYELEDSWLASFRGWPPTVKESKDKKAIMLDWSTWLKVLEHPFVRGTAFSLNAMELLYKYDAALAKEDAFNLVPAACGWLAIQATAPAITKEMEAGRAVFTAGLGRMIPGAPAFPEDLSPLYFTAIRDAINAQAENNPEEWRYVANLVKSTQYTKRTGNALYTMYDSVMKNVDRVRRFARLFKKKEA
jgi:hypothetical protein